MRCLEEQRPKRLIITLLDRQDLEFVLRARIEELRWYGNARGLGPEKDAIFAQRILSCDGDLIANDCDRYLRRIKSSGQCNRLPCNDQVVGVDHVTFLMERY